MRELYRRAMNGIREKVALQEIRKIIRGKDSDGEKLDAIIEIVHAYEEDAELAKREAERREMEADEAEMQKQRVDDMFESMTEPLNKLTIRKKKD